MFESLNSENVFLHLRKGDIREKIILRRDSPEKTFWCLAGIFEKGDDSAKGDAVMSLLVNNDDGCNTIEYQLGIDFNDSIVKDIIREFKERDNYEVTENTRVVFRLFEQDNKTDDITQIIFAGTAEKAQILWKDVKNQN